MKRIVQAIDSFAQPVKFNFKGREAQATKVGALVTIAQFAIFIAFTVIKVQQLVLRQNPTIKITEQGQDTWIQANSYNLKEYKFRPVFILMEYGVDDSYEQIEIPEYYLKLKATLSSSKQVRSRRCVLQDIADAVKNNPEMLTLSANFSYCFELDDVVITGDSNIPGSNLLQVDL